MPVVRVERDFSGTHLSYNFQITHFYHLFSTYDNFTYLYSPHLLESGGHRKDMANDVSGSKDTDTI